MGCKILSSIAILVFSSFHAFGQDSTMLSAFEMGADFMGCESLKKDYIRADNPNYNGIFRSRVTNELQKDFLGVKLEKKTANRGFGFSSGLRFTYLSSRITKNGIPAYFYFRFQQTGTTTEYLRIRELNETSTYLGIPLEVSYHFHKGRMCRFYFMEGAEWSYQLTTKTDVTFYEGAMGIYEPAIEEVMADPAIRTQHFTREPDSY